jgi:SAM-dependent methyltransferase
MESLLEAGYTVTGIDGSAAMLRRAQIRLRRHGIRGALLHGSISRPPLRGRFDLVILAVDTLLHLDTQRQQLDSLEAAHDLLEVGGRLVIDLAAPAAPGWEDWSAGVRPFVPVWSARLDDGTRIDKLSTFSADSSTQVHHVTEFYDVVSHDGAMARTAVEYDLRFIFPGELDLLLKSAGMSLVDRFGDYGLGPFIAGSERQICIAMRSGDRNL